LGTGQKWVNPLTVSPHYRQNARHLSDSQWSNVFSAPPYNGRVLTLIGSAQLTCQKVNVKVKVKVGFFYSATYAAMPRPAALYNRRKWQLIGNCAVFSGSIWAASTALCSSACLLLSLMRPASAAYTARDRTRFSFADRLRRRVGYRMLVRVHRDRDVSTV